METADSELLDPTALTVDELEVEIETGDHTIEELREIRERERASDDPRSTALDAIDEELDALTSGPTGSTAALSRSEEDDEDDTIDESMRHIDGGGATEIGVVGVVLPSPYSDDAPSSLRIHLDTAMGVGGVMFDDVGEHTIPYATPNDQGVAGMRVKRTLESPTNTARLAVSDPLHPNHEE